MPSIEEYFHKYGYQFFRPPDARIFSFEKDNQRMGLEIEVTRGQFSYKVLIEPLPDVESAEVAAWQGYASSADFGAAENIPPRTEKSAAGLSWRFRKAFEDGFKIPFIIDSSFFKTNYGVLLVRYLAEPESFYEMVQEYERLLNSFSFEAQ